MNKKQKAKRLLMVNFRARQKKLKRKDFRKRLHEKIQNGEVRFFQAQSGVSQAIFVNPVQFKSVPTYIHTSENKIPCIGEHSNCPICKLLEEMKKKIEEAENHNE